MSNIWYGDGPFFRTSAAHDVLGSLSLCGRLSATLTDTSQDWKWCLLSTHSALKNALILALTVDHEDAIYTPESLAWLSRIEEDHKRLLVEQEADPSILVADTNSLPLPDIVPFKQLFLMACEPDRMGGKPIKCGKFERWSIFGLETECRDLMRQTAGPAGTQHCDFSQTTSSLAKSIMAAVDAISQLESHPGFRNDPVLGSGEARNAVKASTHAIRSNMSRFV